MKPRNKFQKSIVEASHSLPAITQEQIIFGYKYCIEHIGHKNKKGVITCLECGHKWDDNTKLKNSICPSCSTKLKIEETRKRTFTDIGYLAVLTTQNGYQVIRYLFIECTMKLNQKPYYFHSEVVQRFIDSNGKYAIMAKLKNFSFYQCFWVFHSDLEIRPERNTHNIYHDKIYPKQKILPILKRNGYTNKIFKQITPFDTIRFLLTENKAETLIKAKQYKLFEFLGYNRSRYINQYWASIKISIRNNYFPKDAGIWCDYIDSLRFFNKDLYNEKYVCPVNLQKEHDRLVEKRIQYSLKLKSEEQKKIALDNEELFNKMKSKFFGIQFTDGEIHVKVLDSINDIIKEGEVMKHCVFSNDYYLIQDSLIMSASIADRRLETIEVSLSDLKVIQCRGRFNKNTEYHNRILSIVSKNIHKIAQKI